MSFCADERGPISWDWKGVTHVSAHTAEVIRWKLPFLTSWSLGSPPRLQLFTDRWGGEQKRRVTSLPRKGEGSFSFLSLGLWCHNNSSTVSPCMFTLSWASPQRLIPIRKFAAFLGSVCTFCEATDKFLGELCYRWGWPAGTPAIWKVPCESRDFKMAAASHRRSSDVKWNARKISSNNLHKKDSQLFCICLSMAFISTEKRIAGNKVESKGSKKNFVTW